MRALSLLLLLLAGCQQSAPPPERPPVGTSSGDYSVSNPAITTPEGQRLAAGVVWETDVNQTAFPTKTVFEYTVERTQGHEVSDQVFKGTVSVPNGTSSTRSFPVDVEGRAIGLQITFTGGR